jgi:hypothetical protein
MWQVEWLESVLDELARSWLQADAARRKNITNASHQVDQLLSKDPLNVGESRANDERILLEPPLGVYFQVQGQIVTVFRAWVFDTHPK